MGTGNQNRDIFRSGFCEIWGWKNIALLGVYFVRLLYNFAGRRFLVIVPSGFDVIGSSKFS